MSDELLKNNFNFLLKWPFRVFKGRFYNAGGALTKQQKPEEAAATTGQRLVNRAKTFNLRWQSPVAARNLPAL